MNVFLGFSGISDNQENDFRKVLDDQTGNNDLPVDTNQTYVGSVYSEGGIYIEREIIGYIYISGLLNDHVRTRNPRTNFE